MNEASRLKLFKSSSAEARFHLAYESLLADWENDFQSEWVNTDFGETHVITSGLPNGTPLVLIPGAQGTAGSWGSVISGLSNGRKIYCIDLIDQVGLSRPTSVLSNTADSDLWLMQTLDGLGLDQVDVVGSSLGSFIAAKFASAYPKRIRTLTLTAPAATIANINLFYILQVILVMTIPGSFLKTRFLLKSGAGQIDAKNSLFKVLHAAMFGSSVISKLIPRLLTNDELEALEMPVLLILGEKDIVNTQTPSAICEKLATHIQKLRCEIFADAGHLWAPKHFKSAGEFIESFLSDVT